MSTKQKRILLVAGYLRVAEIEIPNEISLLIAMFCPYAMEFKGNNMKLTMEEKDIITSWFVKIFELAKAKHYSLESKLLYDYNVDGVSGEDFHSKCDGYCNTFTIVQSQYNGHVFGGFLFHELIKEDSYAYYSDNKVFLFILRSGFKDVEVNKSLNIPKMYPVSSEGSKLVYDNCCEY